MITPFASHPITFIQKANSSSKDKKSIGIEDLKEILKQQHLLTAMSDRGLFIVLMSELIQFQFSLFFSRIKALYNEICPPLKIIRKKKEDHQGNAPKRKRRVRVNTDDVNIQQIASDSISNPSHIQAERLNREETKDQSKGSKPSNEGQPVINIDFNAQMGDMGDNGLHVDYQPQIHNEPQDTSSGSQSTKSSNLIPNLSQKLRVLGGDVSFEKRTVPKRRRGRQAGGTIRRKDAVVDFSIILDVTKPTIDLRDLPAPVLKEKCRALDMRKEEQQFDKVLTTMTYQLKTNIFAPEVLRRLKDYEHSKKRNDHAGFAEPYFDLETGNTMFEQEYTVPSTHFSVTQEESNFNKSMQEHIDINFFRGETSTTLTDLKVKTKKPKEEIFLKLLWMANRGQVTLTQDKPDSFGEISVKLAS